MSTWNETPVVFDVGGDQLVGVLHRAPGTEASLGVLIVVGGPQYRVGSHRQFTLMARALAAGGVPVLRFDYRGMGDSDGDARTFEAVADDIQAAIELFRSRVPGLSGVVLWGLCDAASAIMMCASQSPGVVGQVLVNPWARTPSSEAQAYVRHYYGQRLLQRDFWRKLSSGRMDLVGALQDFVRTLRRAVAPATTGAAPAARSFIDRMLHGLLAFRGPTLFLLSEHDLTAREFEALRASSSEWSRALDGARVRSVRLAGADHTFSDRRSLQQATETTLRWMADFLGAPA